MMLFLDFDGVLHPSPGPTDFCRLPLLESWLRTHPDVNIIISSSWREVMDMEVLQHIFSEDLQHRVIDKCPLIHNEEKFEFYRHEEILRWIKQESYDGLWLVLDDAAHEFPAGYDLLIACDKSKGIDEVVINELTKKYGQLKSV